MVLPSSETDKLQGMSPAKNSLDASRPPTNFATKPLRPISTEEQAAFERDGAVALRGILSPEWIDHLRCGFEALEQRFGPDALIERPKVGEGRYVNEQYRWRVIAEFYDFALDSPACELAASLMRSETVNFFIDQYFIKDPGVVLPTPWHQDLPYLSVSGRQMVRLWVPTESMPAEMSLELALGSHKDDTLYRPVQPSPSVDYRYDERMPEMPTEDQIRHQWKVGSWEIGPGDCLAFHAAILHCSPGGIVEGGGRRHVAALLWAGDDARYKILPGRNMPPLPVPDVEDGQRLDSGTFPRVWPRPVTSGLLAMRPPRPSDTFPSNPTSR